MSRLPTLLVLALLATPLASAQASSPMPPPGSVWTVFTSVDAIVRDNYATVKVIADIRNQGPDPEFPFVVRVPDDAFVTGLTITRDGTTFEAEIKDRDAARQEYEDWKAQQQTGGLVEKTRRTSVYSYLINVAEFTSVTATLTYERYLVADRGVYNLSLEAPVSGFGRDLGARFSVTVRDAEGVVALWGEPNGRLDSGTLVYEVGPRQGVEFPTPFTASYTLLPTNDAGSLLTTVVDGRGFFAHRFRAPADAEELPMDLVLVLDVSGSMAGLKLQQMVDAAKQVVQTLRDDDRLHIVAFSSDARSSWTGMLTMNAENRKRAVGEIDALFDAGGTNIESGLRTGFDALSKLDWTAEEGRFPALVLLTDGQPTAGLTAHDQLLALATRLNTREVPVFGIAFGEDADWTLIRRLAQDGEGAAIRVPPGEGAEVDLRRFMAALTTPVLRDINIEYSDGVIASRIGAPVLFAGSELLVIGTFDPAKGIRGTITGWTPDGERSYSFRNGEPSNIPFLPRLVAYHEVRALQDEEDADGATASTTSRIKELALAYGFVTDHTSLVLTLPPREMREWDGTPQPVMASDARNDASAPSSAGGCPGCMTSATPAPTATTPATTSGRVAGSGGSGWFPFNGADSDASATTEQYGNTPPTGEAPEAQVPGAGFALVMIAIVGVALVVARRR